VARIEIMDIGIEYELVGKPGAPAIALVPGGRFAKDADGLPQFAQRLADGGRRVLLWDRPGCGMSDFSLAGNSESELHADVLAELIVALELGPTAVGGGSAGSRVAMLTAARRPELVSHLLLWWISGGATSLMSLGNSYCCEPAIAASMGGMAAVVQLPFWAAMSAQNPSHREYLLGLEPKAFIDVMERWTHAFIPQADNPIPVMGDADWDALSMPVLIFRGSEADLYHPKWVSEWVHKRLPGSTIVDPSWPDDSFARCMAQGAQTGSGHFADWPLIAPDILAFIDA